LSGCSSSRRPEIIGPNMISSSHNSHHSHSCGTRVGIGIGCPSLAAFPSLTSFIPSQQQQQQQQQNNAIETLNQWPASSPTPTPALTPTPTPTSLPTFASLGVPSSPNNLCNFSQEP